MQRRRHAPYTSREPPPPPPPLPSFFSFFLFACACACTLWLGSSSGHACGRRSNRPRVFHSNYSAPSNYQIASDGVASKTRSWMDSFHLFSHPFSSPFNPVFVNFVKIECIHFLFFATNVSFYTSLLLFFLLKKLCQIFFPSIDYSSHVIRLKFIQLIPDILRVMLCLTLDLDLELFLLSLKKKKDSISREGGRKSSMNQGQIIEDLERKTTPKVIP